MCDRVAKIRIVRCSQVDADGARCTRVAGHRIECKFEERKGKAERAELKESKPLPDYSAPRSAATSLGQKKRKRVGPHR